MDTKRRLAEAIREAEVQKTETMNMLAKCTEDGTQETKEEITPDNESAASANGGEQPPAGSAERN